MQEDSPPPEPALALTEADIGPIRATLDRLRAAGFNGTIDELERRVQEAAEAGAEDEGPIDVTDTAFLREMEERQGAKARFARVWRPKVIAALRHSPHVLAAAAVAHVSHNTIMNHRNRDPEFDKAYLEAEAFGLGMLVMSAHSLAVEGVLEPVFHQGVKVGHVRKFSERMQMFMMKNLMPDQFDRASNVNVKVKGGSSEMDALDLASIHTTVSTLSPLMMARQVAMIQGTKPPALPNDGGFITLEDAAAVTEPVPETQL